VAYPVLTVAKYFLSIPDADAGDLMSNLKLQKLLYYSQGIMLLLRGGEPGISGNHLRLEARTGR
jgi:uncharacterized phage-associated protein